MANSNVSLLGISDNLTHATTNGAQTFAPLWAIVVMSFLIVVTILSNSLIILVLLKNRLLRSPFNMCLLSLSVADFLVGTIDMPYYASYTRAGGTWLLGSAHCSLWMFFDYFATGVSLWTLAVISFDRVWAVTWPVPYRQYNSMSKSFVLLGVAWTVSFCGVLPGYIKTRTFSSSSSNATSANFAGQCDWDADGLPSWAASIHVVTVNDLVPFFLTIVCYIVTVTQIIQARRARLRVVGQPVNEVQPMGLVPPVGLAAPTRANRNEKKEKQAFLLLTLLVCAIVVCWTPWFLYFIWNVTTSLWSETGSEVTYWLTYSMSAVNPFLFNVANNDIRLAIRRLVGWTPRDIRRRLQTSQFSTRHNNAVSFRPS